MNLWRRDDRGKPERDKIITKVTDVIMVSGDASGHAKNLMWQQEYRISKKETKDKLIEKEKQNPRSS